MSALRVTRRFRDVDNSYSETDMAGKIGTITIEFICTILNFNSLYNYSLWETYDSIFKRHAEYRLEFFILYSHQLPLLTSN